MTKVVIIGGGLTGLACAFWLRRRCPAWEVHVLEARERPGGNIGTEEHHGFRVERGPNGFLDRSPALPELLKDLGLDGECVAASAASRKNRYLFVDNQLRRLPSGPLGLLTTSLLSWRDKWELLAELWRRPRRDGADESVYDFVARRAGRRAAALFADALVTGIYGGDPRQLSVTACFPSLVEYERRSGSVIRGLLRAMRQRRREARRRGEPPPAPPRLWSFREGLQRLIDALAAAVGPALQLGVAATQLQFHGAEASPRWTVHTSGTPPLPADVVVLACPAYEQARLLEPLDADLAAEVAAIPYNRIAVVALGYRVADCPVLPDGFGYIAPQASGRDVLGVQWCSAIFPERAPPGMVLWRALCGGVHRGELLDEDDSTLLRRVHREMTLVMGVRGEPVFHRIIRWPRAIPQYVLGHGQRQARIEEAVRRWPGLVLSGNAYRGVAMSDCVTEAKRVVEWIVAATASGPSG